MNASAALPKVLEKIDADLDKSLERLFAFLRLQSVSTDPAFAGQCQAAAKFVADDLASLGFDAQVRKTPGHPVVVGKSPNGSGPRVLFYGHYDVQPVDPLGLWTTPPF
jgi:acetylornithine deacetylase/succinyl-diaminopimelate desuccinylase-like protein